MMIERMLEVETYLEMLYRTVLLYIVVLIIFRLMGKREVGELSIMDLVVFVLIAEVVAFSLDDMEKPIFESIFPIIVLFIIQFLNSLLTLKSKKVRDLIDGDPSLVVREGIINQEEMRKQRYNLDDLFQQMREEGIPSVQSISYAFLEPSGKLSIFLKSEDPLILPLIVDGCIVERHLEMINKERQWLLDELGSKGITDVKEVFYCCYENNEVHVQLKTTSNGT